MGTRIEERTVHGPTPGTRRMTAAPVGSRRAPVSAASPAGSVLHALVRTGDRPIDLVVRVMLAVVMFPHGAQKLLGWFGGPGFSGTMGHLTADYGLPAILALLVIVIEFFAPLALALGLFSRAAALGIAAVMIGAVLTSHLPNGFFMNWFGTQGGEGFEYHLLAIGLCASVLVNGSGALSVDGVLTKDAAR